MTEKRRLSAFLLVLVVVLATVPQGVSVNRTSEDLSAFDLHLSGGSGDVDSAFGGRQRAASTAAQLGPGASATSLASTGAGRLHEAGVTGEGVKVGVIGARFDAGHPELSTHVAGTRRFDGNAHLRAGEHDTAVAEVVSDVAPGADLYLASVGENPTPASYARAVDWLVSQDVDVVVDSATYFPRTADGVERMTAAAERAAENGVVFVTSAGNYAERHWSDRVGDDEWVNFSATSEGNALGGGDPVAGRVSLRLYWRSDADYDLYLYRHRPGADAVVAKSTDLQAGEGSHAEAVDVAVPRGRYYVAVHTIRGPTAPSELDLFSAYQPLQYATPNGSVAAPAGGRHVIAVGAIDPGSGAARSYSSRGDSVDLSAPDGLVTGSFGELYGTSAAAPYVAGTAALMESRNRDLSPAEVERLLERTANRSGDAPRLDAVAAVEAAEAAASGSTATPNATADASAATTAPSATATAADESADPTPTATPADSEADGTATGA